MSSNNDSDSWDGPGAWEPVGPNTGRARRASAGRTSRTGMILLAATGLAVVAASTIGIGAAVGWFGTPGGAPPPVAAETAPPQVDDGDDEIEPAEPLAVPDAEPVPLGDEASSAKAADAAVTAVLEAGAEIAQRADGDTEGLENIATGFVQGELQALADERAELRFTQVGEAKVVSVTTRSVDLTADPPTVILDVCIDASGIDVLDENGNSQKDRMYNPGFPTLHSYGAQYIDGLWKIATHEIPDSAPCA